MTATRPWTSRDKIVLVLRYVPEDTEGDVRATLNRYSGLRYKALTAREAGAAGLLGSSHFLRDGPLPGDRIAAYLNLDMVGRVRENRLNVQNVGSSPDWTGLVAAANVPVGFDLALQTDPYLPTDSAAFYSAGIPTANLFSGAHEDYHRPSDSPDKLDYEALREVARFTALLARRIADRDAPLAFARVERRLRRGGSRDTVRAYTGTVPDYASETEGLLLSNVIEGGPAQEAGLRGGDIIVEFAGQAIANIYDYTDALDDVKVDVPVEVVFVRDGVRHTVTPTPGHVRRRPGMIGQRKETRHVHRHEPFQNRPGARTRLRARVARAGVVPGGSARVPFVRAPQGTGQRRSRALRVTHDLGVAGGVRGVDRIGSVSQGACAAERAKGYVPGASAARDVRGGPANPVAPQGASPGAPRRRRTRADCNARLGSTRSVFPVASKG